MQLVFGKLEYYISGVCSGDWNSGVFHPFQTETNYLLRG